MTRRTACSTAPVSSAAASSNASMQADSTRGRNPFRTVNDTDAGAALLRQFEARSPRALARAISHAEGGRGAELIRHLFAKTGRAMTIGLTGPPGVGKSTLSSALVRKARSLGKTVGVVSVDPSSPFSHGA